MRSVPCFTVAGDPHNPDLEAALRLAHECDLDLHCYMPCQAARREALELEHLSYPGDDAVFVALDFAARFVTDILATDGIDELMGGYWFHAHRNDLFPEAAQAFEHFWGRLEEEHLTPMYLSANWLQVNLHWVFLQPSVVEYISRIPIEERVRDGITKSWWRDVARAVGVPEWVISRPKRGFIDGLN